MKSKFMYFGDPLCSWCYGISDNLTLLKEEFKNEVDFEIILGGLRPGGGDEWNATFKEFLRSHWKHVQEASGKKFNYSIFDTFTHFNYDTEPACRAVRVVRNINPEIEFDFFKKIQDHFYVRNGNPGENDFYISICNELDIHSVEFVEKFESEEYKNLVRYDFSLSKQIGVANYPTILIHHKNQYYLVCKGYQPYPVLHKISQNILSS